MHKVIIAGIFLIMLVYPVFGITGPDGREYTDHYLISESMLDWDSAAYGDGIMPNGYYGEKAHIPMYSATDYYIEMNCEMSSTNVNQWGGLIIVAKYSATSGKSYFCSGIYDSNDSKYPYLAYFTVNHLSDLTGFDGSVGVSVHDGYAYGYEDGDYTGKSYNDVNDFWDNVDNIYVVTFRHSTHSDLATRDINSVEVWSNGGDFPVPIAGFHATPTAGDEPLEVKFWDDSDYGDYWIWFFGDNWYLEYDEDNWQYAAGGPTHTYHDPGTYTVKQCVQNEYGEDWENKTSYITVGENYGTNITAQFTADPLSGGKPLTVNFIDQSVGDDLNLWRWYFGDNTYTEYDTDNWEYEAGGPPHTYHDPGYYDVSLMVRNATDEDWEVKTNYIIVYDTGPPNADWFATPESGPAPLDVAFWDTSSGNPTDFYWDYGDGWWTQYDTDDIMYENGGTWHTYNCPGTYLVNLTVTNPFGSDSKSDYITVTSPVNGALTLTALDSTTNALIHSAHVEVQGGGETWYDSNFDGTITMEDLPLGTNYGITVSASGYYDQFFQYTLTKDTSLTVALVRTGTAEEGYSSIDFVVRANVTAIPVRAATVTFADTWTLTDDYGTAHFSVSNTSGNLEWVVSKTGYYSEQGIVDTSSSQTVYVSLFVQPTPTTTIPTPTPSQPGNVSATPTEDTRTPEEKVNDAASIWINGAEFISGLLFLAVIFGIVDLFGGRRRRR